MKKIMFRKGYFIIYSSKITRFLGKFISLTNAMAITLWPVIFIRSDLYGHVGIQELIRHETIHIRQQIELLIIGAWILFILEYIYAKFVLKLDPRQSYYYTAMEQEAHRNAVKVNYLEQRKPYAVLRYIRDKKWLERGSNGELIEKDLIR